MQLQYKGPQDLFESGTFTAPNLFNSILEGLTMSQVCHLVRLPFETTMPAQ